MTADPGKSQDKTEEFFKGFDVVVATNSTKDELVRINSICRAEKILFYAGDIFGFYGFSFMDLVSHEYVEEVKETKEEAKTDGDEPAAKKQKVEPETKSVKKAMTFVSLAETMKVDWSSELYSRRVKRMDPSYFLLQILFEFMAETGRKPRPADKAADLEKMKELRTSTLEKMKIPVGKVTDEILGKFCLITTMIVCLSIFLPWQDCCSESSAPCVPWWEGWWRRRSSRPSLTRTLLTTTISSTTR